MRNFLIRIKANFIWLFCDISDWLRRHMPSALVTPGGRRLRGFLAYEKAHNRKKYEFNRKLRVADETLTYANRLKLDGHSEEEIREQLLFAKKYISQRAAVFMYSSMHDEYFFDGLPEPARIAQLLRYVEYRRQSAGVEDYSIFEEYVRLYGKFRRQSAMIAKAEISGDFGLAEVLRRYN